jgi:hypothetical protein
VKRFLLDWFMGLGGAGGGAVLYADALLNKLLPANNTGLGSTTTQGNVLATQTTARTLLSVINTYLVTALTQAELDVILANPADFVFSIGYGDRRGGSINSRFDTASNWSGAEVKALLLSPEPFSSQPYNHKLTFSRSGGGSVTVIDSHYGENNYGSIRYFTVRKA